MVFATEIFCLLGILVARMTMKLVGYAFVSTSHHLIAAVFDTHFELKKVALRCDTFSEHIPTEKER